MIVILKKRSTKRLLNLKKLFFFKKINSKIELNHEEIVVAIGIIIKPIELKYITLIKIFKNTDTTDIKNGVFVSWLAKKKLEKTFIIAKAGSPNPKK